MANWGKILSRGNVEDRRSMVPLAGGASVLGLVAYVIYNILTGSTPSPADVLNQLNDIQVEQQPGDRSQFEGQDSYEMFVSTVLGSNNDMWSNIFSQMDRTYTPPKLVLFRTATPSACGTATSDVGPHYCPLDKTIYLDETFFDELVSRFGAQGGDVAQAYVIAHEVGHHAQNELGLLRQVQQLENEAPSERNNLSIQTELQADCFAGLWANSIKNMDVLGPGEINEAMDAASAVGDDRIQNSVNGQINPETWTHGSSQQRLSAFNNGYDTGNLAACNTF